MRFPEMNIYSIINISIFIRVLIQFRARRKFPREQACQRRRSSIL